MEELSIDYFFFYNETNPQSLSRSVGSPTKHMVAVSSFDSCLKGPKMFERLVNKTNVLFL